MSLFAHSYEGVSVDELCAAAGVEKAVTPLAMAAFANMHAPLRPYH